MPQQSFKLKPFGSEHPELEISGEIAREGNLLRLYYKLSGDITQLTIPELTALPLRKNELWQHCCFEFFMGVLGEPNYWEFNLAPSGDWNIYRLSGYRENLTPELAYGALPFTVVTAESFCVLELELDLSPIVAADQTVEVGITTVIEEASATEAAPGRISYWAIAHTGPEADFHRRDSFMIQLPGT